MRGDPPGGLRHRTRWWCAPRVRLGDPSPRPRQKPGPRGLVKRNASRRMPILRAARAGAPTRYPPYPLKQQGAVDGDQPSAARCRELRSGVAQDRLATGQVYGGREVPHEPPPSSIRPDADAAERPSDLLDSWKDIAANLKRDMSTVQRREGASRFPCIATCTPGRVVTLHISGFHGRKQEDSCGELTD